uniref:G-protein coupled receptors family 1 profile domain-containing protein n=1 Tax=Cavia porcellus TaxID=10141 RepID=A0A286XLV9_CAVPO
MAKGNNSTVIEFILAGLIEKPELQLPLFLLFLGIYMFTVLGNLGMITLIGLSAPLHTSMYYQLSSLSFIDLSYSTVITPKMLSSFVTEKNIISYPECMIQFYFFLVFVISECHMLAAVAYDHYVAICSPCFTILGHYHVTMSPQVCCWMVGGVYSMYFVRAMAYSVCMLKLLFCNFCDILPLLELSCSSTFNNEVVLLCFSAFNIFLPTLTILSSYIFIIASRSKAFRMYSSHISAVAVFFGSLSFMYLQTSSVNSMQQGKVSSVFYIIVVPMLNPLIYSLRNKNVKTALK